MSNILPDLEKFFIKELSWVDKQLVNYLANQPWLASSQQRYLTKKLNNYCKIRSIGLLLLNHHWSIIYADNWPINHNMVIELAVILELLNLAIEIHDQVIDDKYAIKHNAGYILAGDYLHTSILERLIKLDQWLLLEQVVNATQAINQAEAQLWQYSQPPYDANNQNMLIQQSLLAKFTPLFGLIASIINLASDRLNLSSQTIQQNNLVTELFGNLYIIKQNNQVFDKILAKSIYQQLQAVLSNWQFTQPLSQLSSLVNYWYAEILTNSVIMS